MIRANALFCRASRKDAKGFLLEERFMSDHTYNLAFRRYAPFKKFGGGFDGDNRIKASTSDNVTYRTGAFVSFVRGGVKRAYGKSSGTSWYVGSHTAKIKVTVDKIRKKGSKLSFFTSSEGSNALVPGAPNIDTHVAFGALWAEGLLVVVGNVYGDGFPNGEVYIKDDSGNAVLLVDFRTKSGSGGPFHRLFGDGLSNKIADFECHIQLKDNGSFGKVVQQSPIIFREDALARVSTKHHSTGKLQEFMAA